MHASAAMGDYGTEDLESAYRRVTTMAPGYTVVGAWDPERKETRYFTLTGFNFGSIAAVTYFNAIPSVSASMARRLLASRSAGVRRDGSLASKRERSHKRRAKIYDPITKYTLPHRSRKIQSRLSICTYTCTL